jgi:bacillopeptidase F (M6 metalloprotease family)
MARYRPSDLPMATARVCQAIFPTSRQATWADEFLAEYYGSDSVDVSVLNPSNDPRHANKYALKQNADALRSCSCRTLKLLMV